MCTRKKDVEGFSCGFEVNLKDCIGQSSLGKISIKSTNFFKCNIMNDLTLEKLKNIENQIDEQKNL